MFKKYKKQLLISSVLILLPIVFGLVFWNQLPDSFTTHWGVDGQADGWSSKGFAIFFLPLFLLAMHWFCVWITDLTNRGKEQSPKVMNLIFFIMPVISLLDNGMLYSIALGKEFNINTLMAIMLGLLFTVVGNYLPKCTQNTTVGIKIIWTLSNEENWNATHRFSGKIWVIGGLLTIISAFIPTKIGMPLMLLSLLGSGLGSVLYSYLYYRRQLKAGTAVPVKDIPVEKATKTIYRIVSIVIFAILISVGFMLLGGTIDYEFREDALVMDATFYSPITLKYDTVESIEYREGNVEGSRIGGYGSFRLLLGFFENEEFGTYTRYTYYKPESCIVVTSGGKTLVFSGADAEETQQLYQQLLSRTGK